MRYIFLILIILILTIGCTSTAKYMQKGMYDYAINKSVKILKKKPTKAKEIEVLKESYRISNQQNKDRVEFLKKSGQPDIWNEVFTNFNIMKERQNIVSTLPTSVLNQINFIKIDYDEELINAKKKAADFFYTHALVLLEKQDKHSAREAYNELIRVKQLFNNYKDVDEKINKAAFLGTNQVIFQLKNNSRAILPKDFEFELLKISLKELNTQWLNYDTHKNPEIKYEYSVIMNIKEILVSPEKVEKTKFTEEKEIEDGFRYQKDAKGNVVKDTAGNDIKLPIIKVITCQINELKKHKTAIINGTLDYYDNRTGQLIKTNPITAQSIFENFSSQAVGNLDALKPETRKRVGKTPLPFPSDPAIIMQAGETLKNMCKDIIYKNTNLLMN